MRADHVDTQDAVRRSISDYFDQTRCLVTGHSATTSCQWKHANLHRCFRGAELGFSRANPGNFRMGINHPRHRFIIDLRFTARNPLGNHNPLFHSLVRKHCPPNGIANRVDARTSRFTNLVHFNQSSVIDDNASIQGNQAFRFCPPADRDNQAVNR